MASKRFVKFVQFEGEKTSVREKNRAAIKNPCHP